MNFRLSSRPGANRGFTLIETLLAVTIMGFATVGIVAFIGTGLKMYYADRARLLINRDIRTFTAKLDSDAVTANFFCIYPDFSTRSNVSGGVTVDAVLADGEVGDFLVLVYTDPSSTSLGVSLVTRLVGYYREITSSITTTDPETGATVTRNSGPVRRFDIDLSGAPVNIKSAPFYTLLSNAVTGGVSSYPIVEQLAQDQASTGTPRLFYNFANRSVMVNAQIAESLTEQGTASQTGNTYNFTVSPRG